ncbi:hypothetical protein FHS91_000118 [Sphingobium xanthum]|jgi:hypothetical protein|uniref:hypothetical protein n=1 Tax=Sphingobium xanthum TaxID=1387165 RepID=UPI001C8BFA45|nr:hypothetical protein [Sphingobium xanthum]
MPRTFLALMSALWLVVGSLALSFIVMVGTLAWGAICGQMALVWLLATVLVCALLVLALWLVIAAIRRRLTDGLMRITMIANLTLLFAGAGFAILLGAG